MHTHTHLHTQTEGEKERRRADKCIKKIQIETPEDDKFAYILVCLYTPKTFLQT